MCVIGVVSRIEVTSHFAISVENTSQEHITDDNPNFVPVPGAASLSLQSVHNF